MISKVLVAVRPGYTESNSVKRAKILAQLFKFDLLLYSAVHEDQVSRSGFGTAEALSNIEQSMVKSELRNLNEIKTHFDGLCSSVSVQVEWQKPIAQSVLNAAEAFGADLIVLSGSDRGPIARWFLPHTHWDIIRGTRAPVLVSQDPEPKAYANILAAVDPTHRHDPLGHLDERVVAISAWLAGDAGAELFLGHVYPSRESLAMETYMPPLDEYDNWRTYREAAMQKLAEQHNVNSDHTRLKAGSPASGIVELAQSLSADLVTMGALSRTFRSDRVLGSAAEKVLNKLHCDLLFVPLSVA